MIKVGSEAAQVLVAKVYEAGQQHILAWWEELDADRQHALLNQLGEIDFQLLNHLITRHVKGKGGDRLQVSLPEPVWPVPLPRDASQRKRFAAWRAAGEEALRQGEVAVLVAAGGSASSLGLEGAEALCPVGPVSQKTLLQLHAEKVLALSRCYRKDLPFLLMTSVETEQEIAGFLKEKRYFSLPQGLVVILRQSRLPIVDGRGRIVMQAKDKVAMAPNGHGGAFQLLRQQELRSFLREHGIRIVFLCHVDNPVLQMADPTFVGLHRESNADMSAKVVCKKDPDERVGVFVRYGQHLSVIEYGDLPGELRSSRDSETGELVFRWGNAGQYCVSVDFLERLRPEDYPMPYHCVEVRTAALNRKGETVRPTVPNAFRFESYLFDAFRWAERPILLEADRVEEFWSLRMGRGPRAPEGARQALSEKYARWLEKAGLKVVRGEEGAVRGTYEVSPLYALDPHELREKYHACSEDPVDSLYLQ